MKNLLRAALVAFMAIGIYAGMATPAPAMTQPQSITLSEGGEPTPSSPTCSPTNPCKPPIQPTDPAN
jgi:hypothetical protein